MDKTDHIVTELVDKGFRMTKKEFLNTRVYKILEQYSIDEPLTTEEYLLLVGKLFLTCEEE